MNIQTHDLVRGDLSKTVQSLQKKGIHGRVVNSDRKGKHVVLNPKDITPIDSQRDTYLGWVEKALTSRKGFDYLAANPINVFKTETGYKCWDGIGRLAMAQVQSLPEIDVWLAEGTEKEAAEYFVYNQKDGRRTLSPEIVFSNEVACEDSEALTLLNQLEMTGVCVRTNAEKVLPVDSDNPEIKINAFKKALTITNGDLSVLKMVRDTIVQAYPGTKIVRAELFTGLSWVYTVYEGARRPGATYTALNKFLKHHAELKEQHKLPFKESGGNQHNNEAGSVAYGFVREFTNSNFCTNDMAKHLRHFEICQAACVPQIK